MRIVDVNEFYSPTGGGVRTYIDRKLSVMAALGHQQIVIACGRDDAWSPVSQHQAMQRLSPQTKLRVIEDAGHMVQMERPEQTAAVMLEWLKAP